MPQVEVQPVATRHQRREFLDLPWRLYRDDPLWMPSLRFQEKELVNYKKHPYYEVNLCQTFLATQGGDVVGRIAAILDRGHNAKYPDEQRGFFGFFECVNDQDVAAALFDAARSWHAEHGQSRLRGPLNPSQNYAWGLLVDGFDKSPMFLMPYNPPYYEELLTAAGFIKAQDLYAYHGHVDMLGTLDEKLAFIGAECQERFDVKLRAMDTRRFNEEVEMYIDLYNRSMEGNWGFVPLTPGEARHFAAGLKQLIVPELTSIAEIDGKVVGAAFCMLDYNPRIKAINGRLFPFGFLKLLRNRRAIKAVRSIATTVVPEYQMWGVGLLVLQGLLPRAMEWGAEECEFSWVLESNRLSRTSLERGGTNRTKTYRVYDDPPEA